MFCFSMRTACCCWYARVNSNIFFLLSSEHVLSQTFYICFLFILNLWCILFYYLFVLYFISHLYCILFYLYCILFYYSFVLYFILFFICIVFISIICFYCILLFICTVTINYFMLFFSRSPNVTNCFMVTAYM